MVFRDLDKQALKQNAYTVLSKITLLNDNSVFTEDDFIVDWTYEDYRYVPDVGFIGQFVERILDGNLQNIPENKIFENQEINLQIGIVNALDNATTWYNYGNFLITKVEKTDTTGNYRFESADYTKKFNKEYVDRLEYPCLAMELAYDVCDQADVDLETNSNCYYYIIGEDGLEAGSYSFKINNMYYIFTIANDLEQNDVLYFVESNNELILKKVRYTEGTGYSVTRDTISTTLSPSIGTSTLLTTRKTDYCNFTNNDFVIESNQYEEQDTLRKVMKDIGKLAYSWVRVAEDNKVHIDFVQTNVTSNYDKLSTDEYYVSKKSDLAFGPVNKVLLGMLNIEGENLYRTSSSYTEDTECAIEIWDNNLTYTEDLRAIALLDCDRLFGIEYMPMEIETIGHPWLEGNEKIQLNNVDEEQLETYPFNRKITYAGYIKGVIGAEGNSSQDTEYEYESELVSQVNKTSITVDKHNQTITSLVSNMTDAQSSISTLEQTTDSISATVEYLNNEYETNVIIRKDAEGNPIEVDDAGPYELEDFKIYGGTYQETIAGENGTEVEDTSIHLTGVNTQKENYITLNGNIMQDTKKLPSTYTEVEYIESTGNCYIDTLYTPNANTKIYCKFAHNENASDTPIFGARASGNNNQYILWSHPTGYSSNTTVLFNSTSKNLTNYDMNTIIEFEYDGTGGKYNSQNWTWTTTTGTPNVNMILFGLRTGTTVDGRKFKGKMWSFKIWESDVLVRDLVPCFRNSDNVIGMYDVVNDVFYTNLGTGTFTKGNNFEVLPNPEEPREVEFVEGNQKIQVCGKNLLPNDITTQTINDLVVTKYEDGSINLNGKTNAVTTIRFDTENLVLGKGTYTISSHKTGSVDTTAFINVRYADDSANVGTIALLTANSYTFTLTETSTVYVRIYANSNRTFNNMRIYPMLEKIDEVTDYEPYIGNTYSLYLGESDNVFNIAELKQGAYNSPTNTTRVSWFGKKIKAGDVWNITCNNLSLQFATARCSLSYNGTSNSISQDSGWKTGEYSLTSTGDGYVFMAIRYPSNNTISPSNISNNDFTITYGEKTDYHIELNKIGDYKDRIFKNTLDSPYYDSNFEEGKWLLRKEINKMILDNSQGTADWNSWGRINDTHTNKIVYRRQNWTNFIRGLDSGGLGLICCSHFKGETNGYVTNNNTYYNAICNYNKTGFGISFSINDPNVQTLNDFLSYLDVLRPKVYYVLETPIITEITNQDLINELNELYTTQLYNITNINTNTDYLLPYINIKYNVITPSPSVERPSEIDTVTSKTTTVDYEGCDIDIDYSYNTNLVKVEESNKEFLGNTKQIILPDEYTQVEYIENNGNIYFDTGVVPTNKTKLEMELAYVSGNNNNWICLWGSRTNSTATNFFCLYINQNSLILSPNYAGFDPGTNSTATLVRNQKHQIIQDKGQFYLDGVLQPTASTTNTLSGATRPIYLFTNNNQGSPQYRNLDMKLYRCKFYEDGILIRDFVPCYNSSNTIGLYDLVNDVFYEKLDSGSLVKGSDAPTPDTSMNINVVTGNQSVKIIGKNFLDIQSNINANTGSGLTLTYNSNGSFTMSGTTTRTYGYITEFFDCYLSSGTYTLSITNALTFRIYINGEFADGTSQTLATILANNTSQTFTITKDIKKIRLVVSNMTNNTAYDETIFVMLEKNNQATTYEPYKGNTYNVNLGKNLFNGEFRQGVFNGTQTSNRLFADINYPVKKDVTYTISSNLDTSVYRYTVALASVPFPALSIYYDAGWKTSSSFTFTPIQDGYFGMTISRKDDANLVPSDVNSNNFQLEKGSIATSYSAYFTPIELNKIGTYQDRIFKGKGVQLFKGYANMEIGFLPGSGTYPTTNSSYPNARYQLIELKKGESLTTGGSVNQQGRIRYIDKDTNQVVGTITNTTNAYFTSTGDYSSGFASGRITAVKDFIVGIMLLQDITQDTEFMVNEGTTVELYEPYNSKDKWLLRKEIAIYNAWETINRSSVYTTTTAYQFLLPYQSDSSKRALLKCNYFQNQINNNDVEHVFIGTTNTPGVYDGLNVFLNNTRVASGNEAKTWLKNNGVEVIYPMATATTTEITNTNLISQLNALNICELYPNITYYMTSSEDLTMTSKFSISDLPYKIITIKDEDNNQNVFKPLFRNLELCKIDDYKDYLYIKDGKWYKHAEIGKVILDGSESWARTETQTSGDYYFFVDDVLPNIKFVSDRFIGLSNIGVTTSPYREVQGFDTIYYNNANRSRFYSKATKNINASSFKVWLQTYNIIVYYVLANPTETEITDTEVIDELNRLMTNPLFKGYNHIYLNDELCEKLQIRYLTDSVLNDTYATKSQLNITNNNISALVSKSTLMEDNITSLQLGIDGISTEVTSVQNVTTDLENSINYLNVDMSGNSIIIPTSDENKPYVSTTYQIPYTATFKGESVNPTVTTSSATVTGISVTFTTGFINVGVTSTTAIPTTSNSYAINFSYTSDGKTYLVSKTLNVALSVRGTDGADGTSVTILGSYATLSDLQTAHPTGNAGDSYMVGDDLYVWDVSTSAWKDVGQIKGDDGISTYFYVRYSENASGNPMTTSPTSTSKYIGVCSTISNTAPTAYTSYTWSKYSGEDGDTTYLHIKYSEDGATFVPASDDAAEGDTPSAWVGVLTDTNPTASTTFEDYTWYKFTEDIDDELTTLQNQISQNSTDIGNNYTAIVEKLDDYAKADTVATLKETVETNQTNTEYAISIIRDLEINGVSQVRTEKGFTFDNDGMTIDATNSITKSVTDTNGIQVIDKSGSQESELLFAGYDENTQTSIVRTENLSVSTYFTIGTHSRFEDYQDGTGVFI